MNSLTVITKYYRIIFRNNDQIQKLIYIILILVFGFKVNAQQFAPVGSKWTYQSIGSSGLGFPVAYQFRTENDTIIDGKYSTITSLYSLYESGEWQRTTPKSEIVAASESGDTVFVYLQDSFHIIYDFTAEVGDTIAVTNEPFDGFFYDGNFQQNRFIYKIDSVLSVPNDIDTFLVQYVSYLSEPSDTLAEWGFRDVTDFSSGIPGRIVKGVGALNRIGILGTSSGVTYFFDDEPSYLTCYEDPIRYYSFRDFDCDSLISFYTPTHEPSSNDNLNVNVFPNPFFESITIDHGFYEIIRIEICDVQGRTLKNVNPGLSKTNINTINMPSGIYFISLLFRDGRTKYYRIIKNQ